MKNRRIAFTLLLLLLVMIPVFGQVAAQDAAATNEAVAEATAEATAEAVTSAAATPPETTPVAGVPSSTNTDVSNGVTLLVLLVGLAAIAMVGFGTYVRYSYTPPQE